MRKYTKDQPLLMIPGPVESRDNVLQKTAGRMRAHNEKEFVEAYQTALQQLHPIFDAGESYSPVITAGSGTLAMEMAMINAIDLVKEQKILIAEAGYFGLRTSVIAETYNLKNDKITSELGHKISEDQLRTKLETGEFDIAYIQHVDTSTGVANDIEMFGRICKEYDVMSIVDGVCALGGQPVYQEKWGIDIYFTGAQKALGLPPGLAIMMYSPKARDFSEHREKPIPSYFSNLNNWWPVMDEYKKGAVKYFSTPATNLIMGLAQSTTNLLEEGMDKVYRRHQNLSTKFREEMTAMGFDFLTSPDSSSYTVSTPKYLNPAQGVEFRSKVLEHGVLVARGIQQEVADSYFRVGHMGSISEEQIELTLHAIKQSIE